ncbi:hypothetical protein MTBSS4_80030 [Magnetospirillum sp. SS-4]|nr:hypothetical protein MTBSS4_80030 [Magnetospirillum sp. SS-4]
MAELTAPLFAIDPATPRQPLPGNEGIHARPLQMPSGPPELPESIALGIITPALAKTPDKGDSTLPADLTRLALLLGNQLPDKDFVAADMVRDCFAEFGSSNIRSRALLAVATRLAQGFGSPDRLPLATARAWRMLDPETFEDEMADQLTAIGHFITNWQKSQQTFLVLEFPEIELIEYLFESMNPARHAPQMMEVLNFKVLSNRRQGILRRIPHRVRKAVQDMGGRGPQAVEVIRTSLDFLDQVVTSHGFTPIVDTAAAMREEVAKLLEKMQPALPAPAGEDLGQALGRITPVKIPASELADQAIAAAKTATPTPAAAPPQAARPSPPPPSAATQPSAVPARMPPRRPMIPGPRLSAAARPLAVPAGIGIAPRLPASTRIGTTGRPVLTPGQRPPLPAVAMGPMPVLVTAALPPPAAAETGAKPANALSGRIALPRPGAAPAGTAASEARGTVTALTVVPKTRRPPITQAIKRQSVLKVLRGEPAATVAATLGIRESKLDEWVDAFIAAGAGALSAPKTRKKAAREPEPLSAELLRAKLAEVLATAQMIERAMEAQIQTQPRRPVLLPPPVADKATGHAGRRPRKKG